MWLCVGVCVRVWTFVCVCVCVSPGSVIHAASRRGHGPGGALRQREELLCGAAGELLPPWDGPGAAGRTACTHLPTPLPALYGRAGTIRLSPDSIRYSGADFDMYDDFLGIASIAIRYYDLLQLF